MKYVESITVSPSNKIIKLDTWYQKAEATVCPCDADKPTVCWYSDDECVAAVNPTTGHIYGVSLGTARIYACACDGSGVQDYITVTVSRTVPVERITLNRSYISIEKDTSATLVASIFPEDATDKSLTWCSSNESVASVANGVVCGIKNGTATITATSSNGKSASCTVTVTGDILVSSITVIAPNKNMTVGESAYFTATVLPINATKKSVCWSSENSSIAYVNPDSGLVYAKAVGTTTIYATACDGGGAQGYFTVTVKEVVLAECLNLNPNKMTIAPGEKDLLIASFWPVWTTNTTVKWENSNPGVATIEAKTPVNNTAADVVTVTGISKGTTTITATAKDGSGKKDTCTVTVDPREKVTIKKDSHSFYVKFADGNIWKNIGIDLSNRQENYNQMYPPNMWPEYYDDLIEEEQRYFDNIYKDDYRTIINTYSEEELAFLYIFDPYGIEFYLNKYEVPKSENGSSIDGEKFKQNLRELLFFKDRIYKKIFGVSPKPFTVGQNGQRVDLYTYTDRLDVYTDSELIFGSHTISDAVELLENSVDILLDMLDSVWLPSPKKYILITSAKVIKKFMFAGSITDAFSEAASYLEKYVNGDDDNTDDLMGWAKNLFTSLYELKHNTDEILNLLNIDDIKIYNKINNQSNYLVSFDTGTKSLFVDEIIELCE